MWREVRSVDAFMDLRRRFDAGPAKQRRPLQALGVVDELEAPMTTGETSLFTLSGLVRKFRAIKLLASGVFLEARADRGRGGRGVGRIAGVGEVLVLVGVEVLVT